MNRHAWWCQGSGSGREMMCVGSLSGYPLMTARVNSLLSVITWHHLFTLLQPSPHSSLYPTSCLTHVKCLKSSSLLFYIFLWNPPLCVWWQRSSPHSALPSTTLLLSSLTSLPQPPSLFLSLIDRLQYPASINLTPTWPQISQLCWFIEDGLPVCRSERLLWCM